MYGIIKLGNKDVPMEGNAATPYRYRQIFHEDMLKVVTSPDLLEQGDVIADVSTKLAFVMAKSAEKADMNQLNIESFYSWLEQFDGMDIMIRGEDIIQLYLGSMNPVSESKKNQVEESIEN